MEEEEGEGELSSDAGPCQTEAPLCVFVKNIEKYKARNTEKYLREIQNTEKYIKVFLILDRRSLLFPPPSSYVSSSFREKSTQIGQ